MRRTRELNSVDSGLSRRTFATYERMRASRYMAGYKTDVRSNQNALYSEQRALRETITSAHGWSNTHRCAFNRNSARTQAVRPRSAPASGACLPKRSSTRLLPPLRGSVRAAMSHTTQTPHAGVQGKRIEHPPRKPMLAYSTPLPVAPLAAPYSLAIRGERPGRHARTHRASPVQRAASLAGRP